MNLRLWETSSGRAEGERHGARVLLSDTRHGLQHLVHGASQRLAVRRTNLLIEHETEQLWFWRLVKLEVERARRHDTSFTVLCLRTRGDRTLAEMAHRLRPQLRETDAVTIERDRLLIMLSDTTGEQARHVTERLAEHLELAPERSAPYQVEYPRDALTLGALIDRLFSSDSGVRLRPAG